MWRVLTWLLVAFVFAPLTPAHGGEVAAQALPWRISTSGELVDATGARVLVNGEAVWSLAIALKPDDARMYLDDRQRRGINAIIVAVVELYHSGGPRNAQGDLPFAGAAFLEPQESYFRHIDWLLEAAAERGIVVFLAPAYLGWLCGEQGWCEQIRKLDTQQARAYGRYLGRRYRDRNNVIWMHGGDADARKFGVLPQITSIAEGIREEAPQHLHTAHCHRYTLGSECYAWPWMQIDSVYADCNTIAGVTSRAHANSRRPYLMIEGRYEYQGADARCLRAQFFTSVLGGGVGQMFGTHYVRAFLPEWRAHLESPGARDLTWVSQLLHSLGARTFETTTAAPPGQRSVLLGGYAPEMSREAGVIAASQDGRRVLAYVPTPRPVMFRNSAGNESWCATWIDLATHKQSAARLESLAGGWERAQPSGALDNLLIAERCNRSPQAPNGGPAARKTSPLP
jgi:hypothetical protein